LAGIKTSVMCSRLYVTERMVSTKLDRPAPNSNPPDPFDGGQRGGRLSPHQTDRGVAHAQIVDLGERLAAGRHVQSSKVVVKLFGPFDQRPLEGGLGAVHTGIVVVDALRLEHPLQLTSLLLTQSDAVGGISVVDH